MRWTNISKAQNDKIALNIEQNTLIVSGIITTN